MVLCLVTKVVSCVSIPETLKWRSSCCNSSQKFVKMSWRDCFSADLINKRARYLSSASRECWCVCVCVADYDGLYLMVSTKTKLGTWVIPPTASLRPSLLLYLNQPDMSHIHFAPQCGPLCSWSSGPSGSVNNRVNSRGRQKEELLLL